MTIVITGNPMYGVPSGTCTSTATTLTCVECASTFTQAYILSCLYPLHDQPELTPGSVDTLLPVVHKFDFPKLMARLVAFIKGEREALSHSPPKSSTYAIYWLALAERL
ncbi:hypothetical protein FOA52_003610 [Chlamydomonas sp. UWO 241]|nr:hypothetical protein FOA52_003610 [Chlamydomonas sp. UWO 241]